MILKLHRSNRVAKSIVGAGALFVVVGFVLLFSTTAAVLINAIEPEQGAATNRRVSDASASGGQAVLFSKNAAQTSTPVSSSYASQLALIRSQTVRNTNRDNSPFLNTPSAQLPIDDNSPLLGPRTDYLTKNAGSPESHFSNADDKDGPGEFRIACEFSHFAYDDPLVYPNQPGKSHLHMFFGNTDVNAYSTYDTLINSGGGTCNGLELNRTGYWVPAMFDRDGNVRVPERIVLYYKGYGRAMIGVTDSGEPPSTGAVPYPERLAIVTDKSANELPEFEGKGIGFNFMCGSNKINGAANWELGYDNSENRKIPVCIGNGSPAEGSFRTLLTNIKFPNCWNGQDPSNWKDNIRFPRVGVWEYSDCNRSAPHTYVLPNLEYFVHYPLENGESTEGWYMSSDVDKQSFTRGQAGASLHADWWGGWNKEINLEFLRNCVHINADCGFGYLSDGGDGRNSNPLPGRALRFREQYTGPYKVPASQIFNELCKPMSARSYTKPEDAAWCNP